MRATAIATGALICLALTGCASWTTSTKAVDLGSKSVALDVKQRLIFSAGRLDAQGQTVICAEPSPDALTVISASGGLTLNDGTGRSGNLAAALSENGASIGLRTQSIQLLRDAMYRLCEGYAAGAVTTQEFAAMQRRYQSTMLGLIAIEQLTGPVVAAQALLTASASAQGGASAGDAAVDAAQARLDTATEATLTAQTQLDTAQATLDAKQADIDSQQKMRRAELAKKPEDRDATVLESTQDRLATLATEEVAARNDVADKRRRLQAAQQRQQQTQAELTQARSRVAATASGSGGLGDVARATQLSNKALAEAVAGIVVEINRSYSRDGCLTLVTELVKDPTTLPKLMAADEAGPAARAAQIQKAEARVRDASVAFGQAMAELAKIEAKMAQATSPAEKAAAQAEGAVAVEAVTRADGERTVAQKEAERLRNSANDGGNSAEVLKTSLAVCQQILGEDARTAVAAPLKR